MNIRFAIVENHQVVNVAVADEDFGLQQQWIPCPHHVEIGWHLIGSEWVAPVIDLTPEPLIQPEPTLEDLLAQVNELQSKIIQLSTK